jgi:hypothetical protein
MAIQTIVFATNRADAEAYCRDDLGVPFEDVVFVMNFQLLGDADTSQADVHCTTAFMQVPAYAEVLARFPQNTGDPDA